MSIALATYSIVEMAVYFCFQRTGLVPVVGDSDRSGMEYLIPCVR